jgi:hypothetical protein
MKKLTKQTVALGILALSVAGLAQANGNDSNDGNDGNDGNGHGCNVATLRGLYVFTASGFNVVGGVAQPKAIIELIRFNGDGTLTVPASTHSVNGVVARSPANGPGTYAVAPDCTGTLVFGPPGPTFDVFLAPDGSELDMIQTGPDTPVFQGTVLRLGR